MTDLLSEDELAGLKALADTRPPFESFKEPYCRGAIAIGSACLKCEKCKWEREKISATRAALPRLLYHIDALKAERWEPIETAPKDGTRVLLWIEPREDRWGNVEPCAVIGDWVVWPDRERRSGMRDGWSWYGSAQCDPTHWRPLPAPPSSQLQR